MSDAYVRGLERRVLAGDLTAVRALARVYERIERGLPAVDPEIERALTLAGSALDDEVHNTYGDELPLWNVGGNGYRARNLVAAVLEHLRGEAHDLTAAITEAMREPQPVCSVCRRAMTPDEVGDEMPEERVCDQCAQQDDPEARRVQAAAASAAAGRSTGGRWAHMSGAPSCSATCPRCGRAGNLHHEGGVHYCAECDAHTAGDRLEGCPGIEPEMCNCGHLELAHRGRNGHCLGIGADLDPAYGRPLDEACLCTGFEVA